MSALRVCSRPAIALLFVLAMALTAFPIGGVPTALAAASLQLSQSTAGTGDPIVVAGHGFHPGDGVVIRVNFAVAGGSHPIQTSAAVDNAGNFQGAFTIPDGTVPQIYSITAQDFHKDVASQQLKVLRVVTLNVGSHAQAFPVRAGHNFYVRGTGFLAGDQVNLSAIFPLYGGNSFTENKSAQADSHGRFNDLLMTVPATAKPGTVTLVGVGQRNKAKASADINVVYRPAIALDAASVRPGSSITVLGSGFVPGASVQLSVTIPRSNSSSVTLNKTARADGNGNFSTPLTLPASATPGAYTLTATGGVSGAHTSTQLKVSVQATVALNPDKVYPGGTVLVSGGGYSSDVPITITAMLPVFGGGSRTVTVTTRTGPKGNFAKHLGIPGNTAAGLITVTAKGPHAQVSAHLQVLHLASGVTVTPASVIPGSAVSVHGTGYLTGVTVDIGLQVTLTNGSKSTLSTSATTDAQGRFTATLHIPADVRAGSYSVAARSTASGRTRSTTLSIVRASSHLAVDPGVASPGQAVSILGNGYSAGVTVNVSVAFSLYGGGNRTVTVAAQTNGSGQFSTHLAIPANAAAQQATVVAQGPSTRTTGVLSVRHINATIQTSSAYTSPGTTISVTGNGYLASDRIAVSAVVKLRDGSSKTLTASAVTDKNGRFTAQLQIPANGTAGTYSIVARSTLTGRAPTVRLVIAKLAPSIVAVPATAAPGTVVTVNGFSFAPGQAITVSLNGQKAGTVTTNSAGKFAAKITVPGSAASGTYAITAASAAGRTATLKLAVQRQVATHFYFAAFYTGRGYHEYLNLLNPSGTQAQVTITYQPTVGATHTKSLTVGAYSRLTEDVNADLGTHVSAGAVVAADVPIAAERLVRHGTDFTGGPGSISPSTIWYFANGNTDHRYREFLAIENPNSGPVQVAVHFLPTHHRAFTIYRNVPATSRTTVKVNTYVHNDAVGATVTANSPVVVNRTIYIRHGITSKIGVKAPRTTWYFAGGPSDQSAHHWIGAINPANHAVAITLHTYGPNGQSLGTVQGRLNAFGRAGYLINKIAHQTNAAVVLVSSGPIVAEQTTYAGRMHDTSTDTFGVYAPAKTWEFASVNTQAGEADVLTLFNPALTPISVVVQFMNGKVIERTYIVAPLSQQRIDVGSVAPNQQLGLVVTSNNPLVVLNRAFANNRLGSETSTGIHL